MTESQKWAIDQKDEKGLRETISILTATNHKNKAELIAYCEERLERLDRSAALVEQTEIKQGEFFQ